jgi:hypothetical protein
VLRSDTHSCVGCEQLLRHARAEGLGENAAAATTAAAALTLVEDVEVQGFLPFKLAVLRSMNADLLRSKARAGSVEQQQQGAQQLSGRERALVRLRLLADELMENRRRQLLALWMDQGGVVSFPADMLYTPDLGGSVLPGPLTSTGSTAPLGVNQAPADSSSEARASSSGWPSSWRAGCFHFIHGLF